jgi:hypothetical protein
MAYNPSCWCDQAIECSDCLNGDTPLEVDVVISGVTNNSCSNCTSLNSTFRLVQVPCLFAHCHWSYIADIAQCATSPDYYFDRITLAVNYAIGPNMHSIRVTAYYRNSNCDAGASAISWENTGSGRADCQFSSLSLAFLSNDATGFCTADSSSCTVTAI